MFLTVQSRLLVSFAAASALVSVYGCQRTAEKGPEASAGDAASSAGAGWAANDDPGAGGVGAEPASAGSAGADDSSYAGSAEEGTECRSGQTRCHGQLGFERCNPDGAWGTSQSCGGYSDNGTSSYCATVDEGAGPWAACIDPACWWWLQTGSDLSDGHAGVCVGTDKIRPCAASFLTEPKACDGVCRRVAELDGRVLGYCDPSCADGERECLGGALYRECQAGRWSTQAQSCPDGELCQPLSAGAHSDIKCGGACEPGTSRCTLDAGSVEKCSDAQAWQAAAPCLLGRCIESGAQAQCQTECQPNERACAFDGADSEVVCNDVGLWHAPTACEPGASCRLGSAGAVGCMKCVGPSVPGGNVWGVADSHCAGGVAECAESNDYAAPAPCGKGQSCVELTRGAATLAYCK